MDGRNVRPFEAEGNAPHKGLYGGPEVQISKATIKTQKRYQTGMYYENRKKIDVDV